MLRPFTVGLLILFFNGFTYCLDALVSPVEAATVYVHDNACSKIDDSRSEYYRLQRQLRDNQAEYERSLQTEKEKLSVWRTIQRSLIEIEDHISNFAHNASRAIMNFAVDLGTVLVEIFTVATVYFYKIYVITAKIVLVLVGPFSLALSLIPGFESNLKSWVAQYIHVSLYIPICNIIGFIQALIVSECMYGSSIDTLQGLCAQPMSEVVQSEMSSCLLMNNLSGIVLGIIAIMLYAHVPTFANWLFKGDGSGGLAAAFSVGGGLAATQIRRLLPGQSSGNEANGQTPVSTMNPSIKTNGGNTHV